MDERFRGKGMWIGLAAAGLILMCLLLAGLAMVAMLAPRMNPVVVTAPGSEAAEVAPPPAYYSPGPFGYHMGRGPVWSLFFGIGMIFKLLFFGLVLLLVLRLARRFVWGGRGCCPPYWPAPPGGPQAPGTQDPKGWRHHWHHWGPPPWWAPEAERPRPEGEAGPETPGAGYTGPQE